VADSTTRAETGAGGAPGGVASLARLLRGAGGGTGGGSGDGASGGPGGRGPLEGLEAVSGWLARHRTAVVGSVAAFVVLGALSAANLSLSRTFSILTAVLVFGTQQGAIYALVALGIALVYRSTKVLNFAQGEFGTVPALLVLVILLGGDLDGTVVPADVSLVQLSVLSLLAIGIGAALAIGVNAGIVQRLADANPVTSLVATAGVSFLLIGAQVVVFGLQSRTFPRFLDGSVSLLGISVTRHTFVILFVLAVSAALLAALFRTPVGIALLATAQDPFAASLHGVSTRAMSSLAWGLAGGLAAIGGMLGAGVYQGIEPGQMTTTFLIPAFTAAVLGGITSMVGAVVGGMLLGYVAALADQLVIQFGVSDVIASAPDLAAFAVLLIVLLVRPRGLLGKEA
jgi:branched-chain amino acid transport system permease protein